MEERINRRKATREWRRKVWHDGKWWSVWVRESSNTVSAGVWSCRTDASGVYVFCESKHETRRDEETRLNFFLSHSKPCLVSPRGSAKLERVRTRALPRCQWQLQPKPDIYVNSAKMFLFVSLKSGWTCHALQKLCQIPKYQNNNGEMFYWHCLKSVICMHWSYYTFKQFGEVKVMMQWLCNSSGCILKWHFKFTVFIHHRRCQEEKWGPSPIYPWVKFPDDWRSPFICSNYWYNSLR